MKIDKDGNPIPEDDDIDLDAYEGDDSSDDDDDDIPILVEGRDEIPPEEPEPQEPEAPVGPTVTDLAAQVQTLQAQLGASQSQRATEDALDRGFDRLAESLRGTQQQQNPAQQMVPYADFKAELAKTFYDDPVGTMEKFMQRVAATEIAPALQQTRDLINQTATVTSRQGATANDTSKYIYDNYTEEVEATVKTLPPGPDVYSKAINQVGMAHMSEIISAQVQAATAAAEQTAEPKGPTKRVPNGGVPQGAPNRGAAPKAKRRILSAADRAIADAKGISYADMWRIRNPNG